MNPIILVVGARPNFMKIAPILAELSAREVPTILLHTGQHYDENMSKVFFDQLKIPQPFYNLNINQMINFKQFQHHTNPYENELGFFYLDQ